MLLAWAWAFTLPGLLLTALGVPRARRFAGILSVPGPIVLFVVAVLAIASNASADVVIPGWLPFLPDGAYRARVDQLSAVMLAIVGWVAMLVYIYSLGYMAHDPGRRRFFIYLDLFVATMALLVLAGNLAVLLIGWTGVGITSFLLISYYRDRPGSLAAGLQALAANAIGDGALLLAAVLVPTGCGALAELAGPRCTAVPGGAELVAALLFVAAMAKSAQGPLYFWLPSAMAGPTPISALIHAATMVAAGVYLLVRTNSLFALAPVTAQWVVIVGVATAVLASLASLVQANFKKAIAFSTAAQLGYMFTAAGVGAPFAALFHLAMHASFKALLFLSSGVAIHRAGGEERLAYLGGLRKVLPISHAGFLIGSLALIGVPLTSGAWSKDSILEAAFLNQPAVGVLLLLSVFLTGLYTGRLYFGVYHGPLRLGAAVPGQAQPGEASVGHASEADIAHAHQADPGAQRLMDFALLPLMVASLLAGFLGPYLLNLLHGVLGEAEPLQPISLLGLAAFVLGIAGFGLAGGLRMRASTKAARPGIRQLATADDWADLVGNLVYRGARAWSSSVHAGNLPRYAFGSLIAVATILFLRVVV